MFLIKYCEVVLIYKQDLKQLTHHFNNNITNLSTTI